MMCDEQPGPGILRVVTITAILQHGQTVDVDAVAQRVAAELPGVKLYTERIRDVSRRSFSKHVSLIVDLPGRQKPVNVKVFERKVQCTGLKNDA